jgi:L-amino acid N-acyltransferase YncA
MSAAIRLADRRDAGAIADIYRPSIVGSVTSFELDPPGGDEMAARVEATLTHAPWIVADRDGEVLGYAYASKHNDRAAYQWSMNATVYIAAAHRRRGVGRALYTSLFELLRLQGFYAVHAGITLPNDASVGLHESMGFERVGVYRAVGFKLGAWRDVGWWQLALRERTGTPVPPSSFDQARADEGWARALASGESALSGL